MPAPDVVVYEVGPRDGLQNEPETVPTPAKLELVTRLGAGAAEISADSEQLRRALRNVLDNAVDALTSPRREEPAGDRILTVTTAATTDRVAVTVADNGAGMSPETAARAFIPLFSTKGFGTGLGLPMARRILAQHGGELGIVSADGSGTEVTLWLSREPGRDAPGPRAPGAASAPRSEGE